MATIKRKKIFKYCTAMSSLLLADCVFAGPPYQTDDAEPVDVGHIEIFVAYEQVKTEEGNSGSRPLFELSYGAAPDLQLSIGIPYGFNAPADESSKDGISDTDVSAKYRLIQETDNTPMVSIFPRVSLPTGDADKGLGNGNSQFFLPVWLEKSWGDWQSYGGGGYQINRATDAKNSWFFGWQLQRRISSHWTLGGEIFHTSEDAPGAGGSMGFNLGGAYDFDEYNHLIFSAGRGLTNIDATNQFSSYVGYQLTL